MDTIFITDLRVRTIVGIWDWEQQMPQDVSIDLELDADIAAAAQQDTLEATVDYKSIAKRITRFVEESRFKLIETMAEEIARIVREEYSVAWVRVVVHKPHAVTGSRDVGVAIERGERHS